MRRLFDRLMPRPDNEVALDASPEPAPLPPLRGRRPISSASSSSRGAPPARTLRLPSLFQNTLPSDSDGDNRSSIGSSTSDLDRVSVFRGSIHSGEELTASFPYIHTFMMPVRHRQQTPPMQEIQDIVDEFQARYEAANSGNRREVVLFGSTPTPSPPLPVGPSTEIDLTVSSDESDNETGEEEVQIVDTASSSSVAPSTPRAGINSAPINRRKRRRPPPASGESEDRDNKRALFDGSRAESTSISMENNDVIERFKSALKCSICLDVIEDITSTKCGHVYCAKCIRLAIRVTGKCPLCQRKLQPHDIHGLYF